MAKASDIEGLDGAARVVEGARLALNKRLAEMCGLRAAALDWSDPEGVHGMRVAARRLRSALQDFLPFLPHTRRLRRWRGELREVADALGAVRDPDVALLALAQLSAEETQTGLAVFQSELAAQRDKARAVLVEIIAEERLAVLQARFVLAFDHTLQAARSDAETLTLRQAAQRIVAARWQDFARLSGSLYQPFRVRPLHRLRIAAKRLRYALQLFAPCGPPDTLAPLAAEVGQMQTALGELHDCDQWLQQLGTHLAATTDALGTPERHAAMWLMRHFAKTRAQHYRDALAFWQQWERDDFAARLAEVWNMPSKSSILEKAAEE